MKYKIRISVDADRQFLDKMLREAANWSGNTGINIEEVMSKPEISVILRDWGKPGDTAFIAESEGSNPIGAAWYRFYTEEEHSYGFVSNDIPEIGIAVESEYRNKGVGSTLLQRLIDEATRQDIVKLSLSVDRDNHAVRMYEKAGFVNIDDTSDQHWTMVLYITPN